MGGGGLSEFSSQIFLLGSEFSRSEFSRFEGVWVFGSEYSRPLKEVTRYRRWFLGTCAGCRAVNSPR